MSEPTSVKRYSFWLQSVRARGTRRSRKRHDLCYRQEKLAWFIRKQRILAKERSVK